MYDTVVSRLNQIVMMIMEAARVKEKAKVVVERAAAERYVDMSLCRDVVICK